MPTADNPTAFPIKAIIIGTNCLKYIVSFGQPVIFPEDHNRHKSPGARDNQIPHQSRKVLSRGSRIKIMKIKRRGNHQYSH